MPSVSTVQTASRYGSDSLLPTDAHLARMYAARDEVIVLATAAVKGWRGGGLASVRVSDSIRGLRHGWISAYCPSHTSDYAIILEVSKDGARRCCRTPSCLAHPWQCFPPLFFCRTISRSGKTSSNTRSEPWKVEGQPADRRALTLLPGRTAGMAAPQRPSNNDTNLGSDAHGSRCWTPNQGRMWGGV